MAKTTFLLEINGIELPDEIKAEVSKALNGTLLNQVGKLDLAKINNEYQLNDGRFAYFRKIDRAGGLLKLYRSIQNLNADLPSLNKKIDLTKEFDISFGEH